MKHKKMILLVIICIAFIYLVGVSSIGRYIYNGINNSILESKGFYFNSVVLSSNGSEYSINNWDGVNPYTLTIDTNNKKNNQVYTNTDIIYNIEVSCDDTVICTLSKDSGVIYSEQHSDSYTILVTPTSNFYSGDSVDVTTTVTSSSPYEKTLSATYTIGVANNGFSYRIVDSVGSKYFTLELTNSIPYYKVITAFASYNVDDHISLENYNNLTELEKQNCLSALVAISYSPDIVLLDITDDSYLNRIPNSETNVLINGHNYINGYQFKVDATANEKIIFYKKDTSIDYTYPITNNSSIIDVNVTTIE